MTVRILANLDLAAARSRDGSDPSGVDLDVALEQADTLLSEGADLLGLAVGEGADGAVPTWLGPLVAGLAERCPVVVSTTSVEVARVAVAAGVTVLDDRDGTLGPLAAETGVGVIVTRTGELPPGSATTLAGLVGAELAGRAEALHRAGADPVWIDPGLDLAEGDDMTLLAGLGHLARTGWPVALGLASGAPGPVDGRVGERSPVTAAAATVAVLEGVDLVRVDDVKAAKQAVTVAAGHAQLRRG